MNFALFLAIALSAAIAVLLIRAIARLAAVIISGTL